MTQKIVIDGHPPSLKIFFATEMWERYGFYVVQSLLALYLALHFKWPDEKVYNLVGSFTALTYLSPMIGGWVADHLLGQKRSILAGAVVLFFSYIMLALFGSEKDLTWALSGIAVGTGFLKPNISSLLGNEYPSESPQRESGFTIFYMGLTLGIILGTTLPSQINHYFSWSISFMSAALGMVIAFTVFYFGMLRYKIADYHPSQLTLENTLKALLIMSFVWLVYFSILHYPLVADVAFISVVFLSLSYLIFTVKSESARQARKTMIIGLLCIISVMFWAFYFQMFLSLTLFISRVVKPVLFGLEFPPPYYVSIQSTGMLFLGYFLTRRNPQLNLIQSTLRTGNKFMLAMVCITLAYVLITSICCVSDEDTLLSPFYFIPVYLMISLAELLLSPVGLSAITVLASRKKVSTMMGIFFVSLGIGAYLSGKLANLTAISSETFSITNLKLHYAHAFNELLVILLLATFICYLLNRSIKNLLMKKIL